MKILWQGETEVYVGECGHIVIAQDNPVEGEQIVLITPDNAKVLCDMIGMAIPEAIEAETAWKSRPGSDHA